jgi:hypothetical protein
MPNPGTFPTYESPFGDQSLFTIQETGWITLIDFAVLLEDIRKNHGRVLSFDYKKYEHRYSFLLYKPVADMAEEFEKWINKKTEEIKNNKPDKFPFGPNYMPLSPVLPTIEVSEEGIIPIVPEKLLRLSGELNSKLGRVPLRKDFIRFTFELDVEKKEVWYTDSFYYEENSITHKKGELAFKIYTSHFEDYQALCDIEGFQLTPHQKQEIIQGFTDALEKYKDQPNTIDWIYAKIPDFVLYDRDKDLLLNDLTTLLTAPVNERGVNEEAIVLAIIGSFKTGNERDHDYILARLIDRWHNGKTLFELLYDKMNDKDGDPNFTAFIQLIYILWRLSSSSKAENYTYGKLPSSLSYKSSKIWGFYHSGFSFEFNKDKILANETVVEYAGFSGDKEDPHRWEKSFRKHLYEMYQPISITDADQAGEIKLPETIIPAFYLKAFDDKNTWANFDKAIWLIIDISLSLISVGNLLKLRYLVYLSRTAKTIAIAANSLQVASDVIRVMLHFVNNCNSDFCKKLHTYLFWLDIATLSTDALTRRFLVRSAEDALAAAERNPSIPDKIKNHLRELVGSSTESTSSFFHLDDIIITPETARGIVYGQSKSYTCAATSLRMMLESKGIVYTEEYLAAALQTSTQGASITKIAEALENIRREDILVKTITDIEPDDFFKLLGKDSKAIVSVTHPTKGRHAVIVDAIEEGKVIIRDPLPLNFGSAYSVTLEDFKKLFNKRVVIF